jgi:O-antigen ligase
VKNKFFLFIVISGFLTIALILEIMLISDVKIESSLIKKLGLVTAFLFGIIAGGYFWKSLSRAFLTFLPSLFILNRKLFFIGEFFEVPATFNSTSLTIVDVILVVLFIFMFNARRIVKIFTFKPIFFYICFIIVGILSMTWSTNSLVGLINIPKIIMLPIAYYVFINFFIDNPRNIYYLFHGILISAFFSMIFIWPEYFGIKWFSQFLDKEEEVGGTEVVRAGGMIARSEMALFLASIIPFLFGFGVFYLKKQDRRKVFVYTGIFILTLTMTLNRMHILATLACTGLILLYATKTKKINNKFFIIPFLVIMAIGGILYIVQSNSSDSIDAIIYRDTYSGRFEQYNAAINIIKATNGMGVGMNNYLVSDVSIETLGKNHWVFRSGKTVHNDILRVFSEFGFVGFFFFLSFFVTIFFPRANSLNSRPLLMICKTTATVLFIIGITAPVFNKTYSLIIIGIYLAMIKYSSGVDFLGSITGNYSAIRSSEAVSKKYS